MSGQTIPNYRLKGRFKHPHTKVEDEPVKITYANGTTETKTNRELKERKVENGKCVRCGVEVYWVKVKKSAKTRVWTLFEKESGKVHRHGPS